MAGEVIKRQLRDDALTTRPTQALRARRVEKKAADRSTDLAHIIGLDKEAGDAVNHGVLDSSTKPGHDRLLACAGLKIRDPESFHVIEASLEHPRRHHEDVRGTIED